VEKSKKARVAGQRLVLLCGVAPALWTVALAIFSPSLFTPFDRRVYDGLLQSMPKPAGAGRVAVVDIDERSLATVGQWPWSREVIARLVTRLRDMGAAVIAFDVVFPETDRFEGEPSKEATTDAALADALRLGRVVVGYAFTFNNATVRSTDCALHPLAMPVMQHGESSVEVPAFRATGTICTLPLLMKAADGSGFLNAIPDADGMLRRIPLVIERDGRLYPALGLAAAMAAAGANPVALRVQNVNATSLVLDNGEVPLDGRSNLLLRYHGRSRSLPYVPAVDVLEGRASAATLKDAVVVVGATALGTRDGVSTPFDTVFPGVEVQATVADNLLRRDFISRPPDALTAEMTAVLALGVVVTILVARLGLAWGSAAGLILMLGAWRGSWWLMAAKGQYFSPVFPAIGLVASLLAATLAKLAHERHRAESAADESQAAQRMMVQALLSLTEIRDAETGSHSRRTQQYSRLLAQQLCEHPRFKEYLTPPHIEMLSTLAPLHDIGKVGIPDQLLNKPGALTDEEFGEMKKHPSYGLTVITTAQKRAGAGDDEILSMAKDIVYTHHERWDGLGYPRGLKGEQIPIPGRVMAVVDVYDALTTNRCYRPSLPHDRAVEVIVNGEGTQFDPAIVDAFLRSESLLRRVAHESTDTAFAAVLSARARHADVNARGTKPSSAAP
jgi:HD-GYP domain-containing protein (c-di-GMP phosphodiesterase class II)/CHASE2 domain-containing sensor protein